MSPIRPENRGRYPRNWRQISDEIRFVRAGGRCECRGECGRTPHALAPHDGRCQARHGAVAPISGSKVILTVAHLDHTPENCDPENLRAMCQGCHLHYDRDHHAETAARSRLAEETAGMEPLFGDAS
ncbi:MAG TPA: hypothetical protein VFJ19_09545 [Nocardioidaceae bacterium]|nr:hypothetical protein [Nocardioidaceae bacterium]